MSFHVAHLPFKLSENMVGYVHQLKISLHLQMHSDQIRKALKTLHDFIVIFVD